MQGCGGGAQACRATASEILGRVRGPTAPGAFTHGCHAGLCEIVAPIVIAGERLGALLCGGFFTMEGAEPSSDRDTLLYALDRRARSLALSGDDFLASRQQQPWLDVREIAFVSALLEAAAEDIAAYHVERQPTRPAPPPAEGPARHRYGAIIGASAPMQELYSILDRVVQSDATVLIQGENGTGKELVARAVHDGSARRNRRFVVINCSAFNDNLLDSELFGHKRGAFTGAIADKQGLFEIADQGTFFLDEIGEMSPALQVKVLRVLQEGTFTPVGDTEMRKVNVRTIAATNRDLKALVAAGEFREDLFYRINVINLHIPPLRERREDIELLIEHFLRKHSRGERDRAKTLSDACRQRLLRYDWPGNVRELENEIERLIVLAGDERTIDDPHLSSRLRQHIPGLERAKNPATHSLPEAVRDLERRMILAALERHDWNKTRAAAELEISRRNLIRLVQRYELDAQRK
jgi:two-component system, NtrC family, response regulator HupR/HoxA